MGMIKKTLLELGLIKESNLQVFSKSTRDKKNCNVYLDVLEKIIFIDVQNSNASSLNKQYIKAKYRDKLNSIYEVNDRDYEDENDTQRRIQSLKQFYFDKSILDFGCGKASFLISIKNSAYKISAVEIESSTRNKLASLGVQCYSSLDESEGDLDLITFFHSFEHLTDPLKHLKTAHTKLKKRGKGFIIIEVPHAKDFLLNRAKNSAFIKSTLWSQHLILHTRKSLEVFLLKSGFKNVYIKGVQRFGVSNHLNWLINKKSGGHKQELSFISTTNLELEYESALANIDSTDTLLAIASS